MARQLLCQICTEATVKRYPEYSLSQTGYSLGSSKDIKLRISTPYCALCKIVHSKICGSESIVTLRPSLDLSDENDERASLRKGWHLEILCTQHNHGSIRIATNEQFLWTRYKRLINLDDMSSKAWEDGNPRLINYPLILSWLRDCEVGHTSTCNPNTDQRYKSYVDIILIDVLELRLVRARSDWKYLALSYVWGGVAILQAMIENIATLERQSSLLGLQEKIPKTIRDAMEMTKALKERYLWCNVLYIIQDDAEQKYDQIAHMDVIYRHASLTIAALSSINANSGLPGISREFTGPERCLGGTENMLLIPQPLNLDAIDPLPYERRAWTLQERIFSKRRIYFTEQNIFLSCSRGVSAENDAGRVVRFRDSWEPLNKSEAIEGLAAYVRIVNTYTRRDLSYQSDILNAFHGLGVRLEESCSFFKFKPKDPPELMDQIPMENFRTRFTNGLPENPFDFSLLWAPERILHRRSGSSESEEFFPSWSWAGWIGPVTYHMKWLNDLQTIRWFQSFEVRIYIISIEISGGALRAIERDTRFVTATNDMEISFEGAMSAVTIERLLFTPTMLPDTLHFIAFTVEATKFSILEDFIYEIPSHVENIQGTDCDTGGHKESRGDVAGILFNAATSEKDTSTMKRFWVLLSSTSSSSYSKELLKDLPKSALGGENDRAKNQIANVLLVEWKGPVAERLAIGLIGAKAWQRAGPTKRYIKLR